MKNSCPHEGTTMRNPKKKIVGYLYFCRQGTQNIWFFFRSILNNHPILGIKMVYLELVSFINACI